MEKNGSILFLTFHSLSLISEYGAQLKERRYVLEQTMGLPSVNKQVWAMTLPFIRKSSLRFSCIFFISCFWEAVRLGQFSKRNRMQFLSIIHQVTVFNNILFNPVSPNLWWRLRKGVGYPVKKVGHVVKCLERLCKVKQTLKNRWGCYQLLLCLCETKSEFLLLLALTLLSIAVKSDSS